MESASHCLRRLGASLCLLAFSACGSDDGTTDAATSTATATADSTSTGADETTVGDGDSATTGDGDGDGDGDGMLPFELTSTAFAEGDTVDLMYECGPPNGPGGDVSPPLSWTPGPPGTLSYAVVMHDLDFMNLVHWVIYDIPADVTELPAGIPFQYQPPVPAGSKQASIQGAFFGYLGPCSPGSVNTYEWTVHALPVATLSGVDSSTSDVELAALVEGMPIASASLSAES